MVWGELSEEWFEGVLGVLSELLGVLSGLSSV